MLLIFSSSFVLHFLLSWSFLLCNLENIERKLMVTLLMIHYCSVVRALRVCIWVMIAIWLKMTFPLTGHHFSSHSFTAVCFESIICRHSHFFCKSCHFSLSHQFFRTNGEVSDSLFPTVFFAFFHHHIAGFWWEHLLKVVQRLRK